jgi:glycerol-1-phosphatase
VSSPAVVCCDLDGVLWRGDEAIPGSAAAVAALRADGVRVGFLTNNSSRTVATIVEQLDSMGVPAAADDVLTSAQAAARLLAEQTPAGARVMACAGPGVVEALTSQGFEVVGEPPVDAVVVGWHRDFDFDRLDRASAAVRGGARFVATNVDPTYPGRDHLLPGAGAIVAAIATAAGTRPEVAGKPEAPTVALVRERLGRFGVMVGDRPSTDGALADALGWPFALVLSGVTGRDARPGGEGVPDPPPPFVADDLAALVPTLRAALVSGG